MKQQIFFPQNGRLGNQVFQYFGSRKYFSNAKIWFFGFSSFDSCFNQDICVSSVQFIQVSRLVRLILYCLRLLAKFRLIGSIEECFKDQKYSLIYKPGLIKWCFLAENIFFQHQCASNLLPKNLCFDQSVIDQARNWVDQKIGLRRNESMLIGVHIRRGDYLHWPSEELSAALPLQWYRQRMAEFEKRERDVIFLVMSDDRDIASEFKFDQGRPILFSDNTEFVDLCLFSMCDGGILSASSFSLVGAWLSYARQDFNAYFVGPNNWFGHNLGVWTPPGFIMQWIDYR